MARTKQTYRSTTKPEKRVTRRFSCTVGKSSKFWEITLRGNETSVQYGKIGSAGTSGPRKLHESAEAAQAEVDKLVREKLKGGYLEEVAEKDDNDDDEENSAGNDDKDDNDDDDDDEAPKAISSSASAKRSRLNAKGKASTTARTAAKYISIGYDEFEVENPFDDEGSEGDGEFQNGRPILPKKVHKLLSIGDIVDFSPDDSDGGSCLFVGAGHVWLSGSHSGNREALTVPLAISTRFADAVAHYAQVMSDRSNCYYFLSGKDAWIQKQFADADAAADLDPDWIFEIEFQQDSLASVSVVSRAWAEFSRSRQDDDDDSGDVLASVDFRDRDDAAGTDPIDSASTWVPLLVSKMKAEGEE